MEADVMRCKDLSGQKWLLYAYPGDQFAPDSKLIVAENQVAVFVYQDKIRDFFTPGSYFLNYQTIPQLHSDEDLYGPETGDFRAKLYFINTEDALRMNWGLKGSIQGDGETKFLMRSFGEFDVYIDNYRSFLNSILPLIPKEEEVVDFIRLSAELRRDMAREIKQEILSFLREKNVSATDINAYREEMAREAKGKINTKFIKAGLRLVDLTIEYIYFPNADMEALDAFIQNEPKEEKSETVPEEEIYGKEPEEAEGSDEVSDQGDFSSENKEEETPKKEADSGLSREDSSKICQACHFENKADALFCGNCGKNLSEETPVMVCRFCGTVNEGYYTYCNQCGRKL